MYGIVLKNRAGNYGEILTGVDLGSFKYDYEKNGDRSVSFTAYKTNRNADIFDMLVNENIIQWEGQDYIIKSTTLDYNDRTLSCEIVAKHIFMEFQNYYIDKDIEGQELNTETSEDDEDDSSGEEREDLYTVEQYLQFGFKGIDEFSYEIIGDKNKRGPVPELGAKYGLEFVTTGADIFGYTYFADNTHFYIFMSDDDFYKRSDEVLVYEYNLSNVKATVDTSEMKTQIKGYGKKKTKAETKNYNPVKPKDLKLSGDFRKDGTWNTTKTGASYSKTFTCKWGNETLTWTNKKMSKGGDVEVYLDGVKVGTFSQYNKTTKTNSVVIARNLEKGEHTFKVVFKGPTKGVDYKKSEPRMYVGTEKATIINITAVLKGSDVYHVHGEYTSPNAKNLNFGIKQAATLFDEDIKYQDDLDDRLKQELKDEPNVELSTEYYGYEDIYENNTIRFVHKPMKFNLDLKVIKITKYHPYLNEPSVIEFSNEPADITKIQQQINQRMYNSNSSIAFGGWDVDNLSIQGYSDVVGSVLIDG